MRTRRGIIGLPVVCLESGRRLGEVRDVLISRRGDRLSGLRVVCPGRFSQKALRFKDIHSLGEDAVIIHEPADLLAPSRVRGAEAGSRGPEALIGKRVLTAEGRDVGIIDDLAIDERSGLLIGYQVSGGLFRDIVDGKIVMPVPPRMTVGRDAVIVPTEWAARPQTKANEGGLGAEDNNLPAMRE